MEQGRSRVNPCCIFFALIAIGAIALMVIAQVDLSSIAVSRHAVENHGDQAVIATEWIATHGGPGNRWDCNDGRQRWIVPYGYHAWAIEVLEAGEQITAFITDDQDYVMKQHDGCKQWQNWAHP